MQSIAATYSFSGVPGNSDSAKSYNRFSAAVAAITLRVTDGAEKERRGAIVVFEDIVGDEASPIHIHICSGVSGAIGE